MEMRFFKNGQLKDKEVKYKTKNSNLNVRFEFFFVCFAILIRGSELPCKPF